MPTLSELVTSNFKPLFDPAQSKIPDLYEWAKKQSPEFWEQYKSLSLEEFKQAFKPYCPHCQIDYKCMTLSYARPSGVSKGICIQCQVFLKTGKRGGLQR